MDWFLYDRHLRNERVNTSKSECDSNLFAGTRRKIVSNCDIVECCRIFRTLNSIKKKIRNDIVNKT